MSNEQKRIEAAQEATEKEILGWVEMILTDDYGAEVAQDIVRRVIEAHENAGEEI